MRKCMKTFLHRSLMYSKNFGRGILRGTVWCGEFYNFEIRRRSGMQHLVDANDICVCIIYALATKKNLWKCKEWNQLQEFPTLSIYYNIAQCTFYHLHTFYHDYVLWNCVHVIKCRNALPCKLLRMYICGIIPLVWISMRFLLNLQTIGIQNLKIGLKSIFKIE